MSISQTKEFLSEKRLIAYLDLSNIFHWQATLKWNFSIFYVIKQLFEISVLNEVRIYYGLNQRELNKSENFHRHLRQTGAIVITKPVKWIRKDITKGLFVKPITLGLFDSQAHAKLSELVEYLQQQGIKIEEPKCNFDVEIALNLLDAADYVSGVLIFSGDSDFKEPLQRLRLKGKNVYIFGVRGMVGKELWQVCSKYFDFGQWYRGPKMRKPRLE